MSKLKDIIDLVRSINEDEFREQITSGESLDDLHAELLFLKSKNESRKRRTNVIIEHISNCYAGDFFNELPISDEEDDLDVVCMGFNTYMEELKSTMVSKNILKEQNRKLLKEKNRSEQLAKAKDEFVSGMSHEIRTPLSGILGFTDILLKNESLDDESLKQLNYIKMLGDTLRVIIDDILDLAKIESGQISLQKQPFSLSLLAQFIYDTFSIKTTEKEIDFEILVEPNVPKYLIGDSTRISQILYNLISNAVKFTPSNQKVGLRICLDRKEKGYNFIKLIVKDTGIGIPSDRIDHIFEPFTQVSNDTARQYGGTGLGLSIVKKIISIMKGEIVVESDFGVGTTFMVTIPLKESISDAATLKVINQNSQDSLNWSDNKTIKVLLAEDNPINQIVAQKILSGFKFECVTVENGKLAVEAVLNNDFDVVLMDLMMPEMDGYEASILIRNLEDNQKKNIPIIALTALVSDSVMDKCTSMGIDSYLSKPFKSDELYDKIVVAIQDKGSLVL